MKVKSLIKSTQENALSRKHGIFRSHTIKILILFLSESREATVLDSGLSQAQKIRQNKNEVNAARCHIITLKSKEDHFSKDKQTNKQTTPGDSEGAQRIAGMIRKSPLF